MAKDSWSHLAELGLTEEQYHDASEKAEDARKRLEAGEELGIDLMPALDTLINFYEELSCIQSK